MFVYFFASSKLRAFSVSPLFQSLSPNTNPIHSLSASPQSLVKHRAQRPTLVWDIRIRDDILGVNWKLSTYTRFPG
jgi:hypothetical protein